MVKQYITTLKNGAREQKAHILGRNITLRDGEVVYEGILTKTFPSLFEEIVDISIHAKAPEEAVVEAEAPETMLTEDSSDVQGVVEEAEAEEAVVEVEAEEAVKKSNSKRATKAK